jgi:nitrate/nitrite transport system ATP-binding protein
MMFQEFALFPWKTVEGNVAWGLEVQGFERQKIAQTVQAYLEMIGLTEFRKHYPAELSGGMKQRVALARVLAFNPKVLLMDEPFGALDALTRASLQDAVAEIHARVGCTVLMITHDVDEAVYLSDRIVMMTNGPSATIGEILDVDLSRPRARAAIADDPRFMHYRLRVLDFLHTRHAARAA